MSSEALPRRRINGHQNRAATMMLRTSSRFLSRAATRNIVQRSSSRQDPRALIASTTRCFSSSNDEKETTIKEQVSIEEENITTITFTNNPLVNHPKANQSSSSNDFDISEFTQEVRITMPDMGESTGAFFVRLDTVFVGCFEW